MLRARATAVLTALAMVVVLASPAAADDLKSRQDRTQRDKNAVMAKLDLARSSDAKVEAEAARLSRSVDSQSSRLAQAQQAQWAAEAELAASADRLAAVEGRARQVRTALEGRAVYAYLHPAPSLFEEIAKAPTLTEAGRRMALLDYAQASSTASLDRFRDAIKDLGQAKAEHETARKRARSRAEAEAGERNRLAQAQRQTDAAHAELARRIAQLKDEETALVSEDAKIRGLLSAQAAANAAKLAQTSGKGGKGNANPLGRAFDKPSASGFLWPVHGPVTSEFGNRWDGFHGGIDIGVVSGTPIAAAKDGVVSYAGWNDGGYGNLVLVDHGNGFATAYGHQSRVASSVGQVVKQGQTIGYSGCTGYCSGDHVHFEVRVNGSPQNPRGFVSGGL